MNRDPILYLLVGIAIGLAVAILILKDEVRPAKLQVLHWRVNTQKANLWWPDMWGAQESLL